MSRYEVQPDGCWRWTGTMMNVGYGQISRHGRNVPAHRAMYEHLRGPIPGDLDLDHLCNNRACVNPDHLEPVTRSENTLRGIAYKRRQAGQQPLWDEAA
ncbi:HNH endonuclease signature motif containing protein [Micromonospora sp. NPDC049891]|uniref:HNH endonuclease signature motif containing protein n=1 Tax=Micromonospora sp. NPDC049891 TaxID=3155655 RepID=UPI0033E58AFA